MSLGSDNFNRLVEQLIVLLTNPAEDLVASLVLYGIIALLLLILVVLALLYLSSSGRDDEEAEFTDADFYDPEHPDEPVTPQAPVEVAEAPKRAVKKSRPPSAIGKLIGNVPVTALIALSIAGAWVLAGYTTGTGQVCTSCHLQTPHQERDSGGTDLHSKADCVACHEPGGWFGHTVTNVPLRVIHFIDGASEDRVVSEEYGSVTSAACLECHRQDVAETVTDKELGLRMSHAEPITVAVRCVECHQLEGGVVAGHNAGMNPCLRCHNAETASAECSVCHTGNEAAAARAKAGKLARPQVADLSCGGCHEEERECDSCHGIRMPHTAEFMAYGHARAGAIDVWQNGGKGCRKCHSESRRPCTACHGLWPGKGHYPGMRTEHVRASEAACDSCHQKLAPQKSRDFCKDTCHSEFATEDGKR